MSLRDTPEQLRYVFVEPARCPRCQSTRLRVYKSSRPEPQVMNRYTRCKICELRFIQVFEDEFHNVENQNPLHDRMTL